MLLNLREKMLLDKLKKDIPDDSKNTLCTGNTFKYHSQQDDIYLAFFLNLFSSKTWILGKL